MNAILAISGATWTELRRQRLLIVPLIAVVLSLILLGGAIIVDNSIGDLHRDNAEFAAFSAGSGAGVGAALYALIIGSSLIARELSSGTLLMLAARPVARWQIYVGRLLASGVFLLACLVVVDLIYGLVACALAGSVAPIDDGMVSMVFTVPAVVLALCVGAAFSVQARPTAAIGTAVAVCAFALFVTIYAANWQQEHHLRSYLVDDARDHLDSDSPAMGRIAVGVVRVLPFGVFAAQAIGTADHLDPSPYAQDHDKRIDTRANGSAYFAQAASDQPPSVSGAIEPPQMHRPTLEDIDRGHALLCGNAQCFYGVRGAWKQRMIPPVPELDDGSSVLFAWLTIPLWALIGIGLLARRRDLV
jgi:hypothetical protein